MNPTPSCLTCYYSKNGKQPCNRHLDKIKPDYSKGSECAYNNYAHYLPFDSVAVKPYPTPIRTLPGKHCTFYICPKCHNQTNHRYNYEWGCVVKCFSCNTFLAHEVKNKELFVAWQLKKLNAFLESEPKK